MHVFGMIAFISTFTLGSLAFIKDGKQLTELLFYGILVFLLNLFYLKMIRLSREDYEEQLKKEKDYSQALLISQKQFLRYAVHETNTPLAAIMANIELYELEVGKHPTLSNIEAATKNIYGIYDDLSYLTKKDKLVYPKQTINLGDFIHTRIDFFNIVAKQSKLSFEFKNYCKDATISMNETKLQRIIDNNITNAIKYTKKFKLIRITFKEEDDFCIFKIASDSSQIEEPEKIFQAYYRESNVKDGLGLGLKLVKSICDEENIRIVLDSNEKCTTFKYYFSKGLK
jgi:signal transduction histidine kinase